MRDIINRAIAPGFSYAQEMEEIFADCFHGYDLTRMNDADICEVIEMFVRDSIEYEDDPEDTEYVMYPHVIFREGYGDCDDMTVLACSLAKMADVKSVQIQAIRYKGDKYFSHVYPYLNGKIYDPCLPPDEAAVIVKGDRFVTVGV